MCAIMIAKSQFDIGINIQHAATMLLARFPFFWCISTSNTLKTQCIEVNTQDSTRECAHFPSPCTFFTLAYPVLLQHTPTPCNVVLLVHRRSSSSLRSLTCPHHSSPHWTTAIVDIGRQKQLNLCSLSKERVGWQTIDLQRLFSQKGTSHKGTKSLMASRPDDMKCTGPHGWGP